MRGSLFSFFLSALSLLALASASVAEPSKNAGDEWVYMPAGAKPAYVGIHGGTMPVSLFVSGDRAALMPFVGQTGNDFLEVMRKSWFPLPSFGNSTYYHRGALIAQPEGLYAGTPGASMPVAPFAGDLRSGLRGLQPFGLSPEPLDIEGEVSKPAVSAPPRKYRLLDSRDFFKNPRKSD